MGKRGLLHDDRQRLGRARWRHMHWVTCVLAFKGRHRAVMTPRRYSELFFLDEAVALAADIDPVLHEERVEARTRGAAGGPRPTGGPQRPTALEVTVLTPRSTVAALRAGYMPALHPSAS